MLDALQVLLPGVFVVLVVWLGARFAVAGAITPGELVAFYGYAAFLMIPLRTATEYADKMIRARVAGRAGSAGCSRSSPTRRPRGRRPHRRRPARDLADARTGLRIRPGR